MPQKTQPPNFDDWVQSQSFSPLDDLKSFAAQNQLEIGSTTGGRHNLGSKHYSGRAIDIRNSGNFSDQQVQELSAAAANAGFKLRDERRRPVGQAVWGGPHVHLETTDQQVPRFDDWVQDSGQTPTARTSELNAAKQTSASPVNPTSAPSVPIEQALQRLTQQTNRAVFRIRPQSPTRADLFRRLGQQRTIDQSQREQEQAAQKEAQAELQSERGPYGAPSLRGILRLASRPTEKLSEIFKSDDEIIRERAAEKIHQQRVAAEPEVTEVRKEYGRMPAAVRSVAAPVIGRGGSGLLKVAGGVASAFGIAPNRLSDWANKRAEIIETGSSLAPLAKERGLSTLITGQPEFKEVERSIPEKVATGIADLGVGLGSIILLKKATNLPFPQLLALEAAAKNADKPVGKQLAAAGEGYALGRALDSHLSRSANAALFGVPTAAQTGYEVSQGRMSPLDAAIQTGIQTGAGALLTPKRESASGRLRDVAKTEATRGTAPITEGSQLAYPRGGLRERLQQRPTEEATAEPLERYLDEPQTKTQSPVEAQREAVERSQQSTASPPVAQEVEGPNRVVEEYREPASELPEQPQRFYHRDYGEVAESPNQRRVGKGRVRVIAEDGTEHIVKRPQGTGAGNQRAVPIRGSQGQPEPPPESQSTTPTPEAAGSAAVPTGSGIRETSAPESKTAAKKASFAADRAELDLPDLPDAQRRSWQSLLDKAQPERASTLAEEVLRRPRGLTDQESANVVVRAQQIKNEHAQKLQEIAETKDESAIQQRKAELDALEVEFDRLSTAAKQSGTENARALAAHRLTINQDFDLVSVLSRAKAAKGKDLTSEERADYERLVAQNTALEKKLAEVEQTASSKTLQREVDRFYRSQRRAAEKKTLDDEAVVIRQRIADAWMQVKSPSSSVQPSGLGRLDPLVEPILDYARNRVRAGVIDATKLVDVVHEAVKDVAEISKRDIQQIISGYGLTPRGNRHSEAAKELARIRTELRRSLRQELGPEQGPQLGPKQGPRKSDAAKLPTEGPPSQEAARRRLEERAAELEGQLASGNFTASAPRPKPMPTQEVFNLQRRITEAKQQIEARLQAQGESTLQRLGRRLRDILGLYRAVETSFDLSWALRQGKPGLARHPVLWSRAFLAQFKGLSNDRYFQAAKEIENDPEFRYLNKFGLETPSVDSIRVGAPTHTRAEEFQTELAHKIPGLRQSEQLYNIGLDTLRTLWAKHDMQMLRKAGFSPDNPADFPVFKRAMQDINTFTGRTNLAELIPGKVGESANRATPIINQFTYAVRFWASRLKILTSPLDPKMYPQPKFTESVYKSLPRVQRVEAWRRLFSFYGLVGGQMLAAKYLLGFDIDLNPDSPDFLKIRRGKRVFDLSAGMVNHLRLAARMAERIAGMKKEQKPAIETLGDYLRTKESPVASRVHDILLSRRSKQTYSIPFTNRKVRAGTDFKGDPVYPFGKPNSGFLGRLRSARLLPKPLGLEDALEAYEQLGWGGVATTVPATTLGEGVQVYPKKSRARKVSGYK